MLIRLSKILLVASVALFATLVVFNNVVDYGSNYAFVHHVLKMDTVFSPEQAAWRAIESTAVHHTAYILIISFEATIAVLCWIGVARLWQDRHDAVAFDAAKSFAIVGLVAGILLWFTGFNVVGGEWFLMWQSKQWNGLSSSRAFTMILALILIFVHMPERDATSQ